MNQVEQRVLESMWKYANDNGTNYLGGTLGAIGGGVIGGGLGAAGGLYGGALASRPALQRIGRLAARATLNPNAARGGRQLSRLGTVGGRAVRGVAKGGIAGGLAGLIGGGLIGAMAGS